MAIFPRVLVITNVFAPYRVPAFAELAKRVDLGVLFCGDGGPIGSDWRFPETLPFSFRVERRLGIGGRETPYYPSPRILATITRARPDVIVSGGYSFPTLYAASYCAVTNCRLVVYSDGTSRSERVLSRSQRLARALLLPRVAACVAASDQATRRFAELGVAESRIFLSPHTTDLGPLWRAGEGRARATGGTMRILSVGRLIEGKGIDRLLIAMRRLSGEVAVELSIVGAGPEEESLRRLAHGLDGVSFHGFVQQSDLPQHYRSADVFVFPTFDDTFGMVLLEAAAAALPVVASPYAGATAGLVIHGRTGFVVDPGDTDAMASALLELARNPARRLEMGNAARELTFTRTPAIAADGYYLAIQAALRQ